jgi:hypothetical protein
MVRASKNRGPDLAHGSWLTLAALPPSRQLEAGTDLPSKAPLVGAFVRHAMRVLT